MTAASEPSVRDKEAILKVLKAQLSGMDRVLDIGCGGGRHSVYFARHLPHLDWLPGEAEENLAKVQTWVEAAGINNISSPVELDVDQARWPLLKVDGVFCAASVKRTPWQSMKNLFAGVTRLLRPQGIFCLYGAFVYDARHGHGHSRENRHETDIAPVESGTKNGVYDFDRVVALGQQNELRLIEDHELAEGHHLLVWQKVKVIEL